MSNILSPLQENCVLWLSFGEGSGTTAYDYSSEGNNGTLVNSPSWDKQKDGGYSLQGNGTNSYVTISGFSLTDTYTVGLWFKIPIIGTSGIMFSGGGTGVNRYPDIIIQATGELISRSNDRHGGTSGGILEIDTWYFVVIRAEGGGASSMFLNGELVDTYNNTSYDNVFYNTINLFRRGDGTQYSNQYIRLPFVRSDIMSDEAIKKFYQDTFIQ